MPNQPAESIDQYIAEFPPETKRLLEELRALIRKAVPEATETISYAIPTFDLNGKHLVHFAGWSEHISFYPVPNGIESLDQELEPYKSGKGTARFPLGKPLPRDLIRRLIDYRVGEITRKKAK
jgi:uncharacterized protein YdhG (YjbR/CyaY superfamily)